MFSPPHHHYYPPFSLLALLSLLLPPPISPTSFALTFWLAELVGRPARWLYLFVLIADGLLAGCGIRCLASTTCGPSVYLSLVHVACLSFSLFCLWHLCFFSVACQDSSLCRDYKKSTFPPLSCHASKVAIFCTFSPFLLFFFGSLLNRPLFWCWERSGC